MGLTNSYWAIILLWAANPLGIFLMRQNMTRLPDALPESARIDGATEFQLYYRIALPTMKSSRQRSLSSCSSSSGTCSCSRWSS